MGKGQGGNGGVIINTSSSTGKLVIKPSILVCFHRNHQKDRLFI
jgi:hypothetical protein